ncbi:MAG: calycin-like domain-containing protein [Pseudoflavonifractor sp.]|nr:calycin-like domain-containing protein [Alloprevotella sp.]MCM1117106.1 calycin-like domain-containing protein [Pseudoflavonifractor sp.]
MRKIYLSLACAAVTLSSAAQLPDPTFASWVDCIPWTSNGNEKAQGTQPTGWTISNVIGINGMGATTVGTETEGINGGKAVELTNNPNPYMAAQIVPGYLTLGTTWSTAVGMEVMKGDLSNNDGGSFGGLELTKRPDGVHFSYKRSVAEGSEQNATVVAYLWKGTYEQADVPGNIVLMGAPATTTMVNRDRNILGMETSKGGEVTKSEGAALIAKAIHPIAATPSDWTELTVPLTYESDETPEMINVIFAANDYFDADKIDQGNTLTVAEPKLVYWSKLSSIEISGTELAGFDDATYEYTVATLPAAEDVKATVLGAAASASVKAEEGKIVITVTNADGTDEEGLSEHTYTLTAKSSEPAPEPAGPAVEYNGKLVVEMGGEDITEGGTDTTIQIIPTTDGNCTFLLPDLSLPTLGGSLGAIKVDGVKTETIDGLTTYNGSIEGMKLMDGQITANVTLTGTTTAEGKAHMTIDVLWVDMNMPITCTFEGQATSGISSIMIDNSAAPVEYFDLRGVRVSPSALTPGLYIRRQGSESTKVLVR